MVRRKEANFCLAIFVQIWLLKCFCSSISTNQPTHGDKTAHSVCVPCFCTKLPGWEWFLNLPKIPIVTLVFLQALYSGPLLLYINERERGNKTALDNCAFFAQVNSNEWSRLSSHSLKRICVCSCVSLLTLYVFKPLLYFSKSIWLKLKTYLSNSWFQHAAENGKLLKVASFAGEIFNIWREREKKSMSGTFFDCDDI